MTDGWRKLEEGLTFDGSYRRIVTRRFERPDGSVADYEVKAEKSVVAVLALTDADEVLLVREFRVGPEEALLELPGGIVDDREEPVEAGRRELLEETGFAGTIACVAQIVDCAYSTRSKHVCVATGCRPVSEPKLDAGEFLELVRMPLRAFRDHLRGGRLTDVDVGYRGLDHLGLL